MKLWPRGVSRLEGDASKKTKTAAYLVILAVLAIAVFISWHAHSNKVKEQSTFPSDQQILDAKVGYARNIAAQQNYATALALYTAAAREAIDLNQGTKAESLLQEAIDKIPDKYITWDVYQMRADAAKLAGDKQLEKQSLQTAIQKANTENVPAEQINFLQNELNGIK